MADELCKHDHSKCRECHPCECWKYVMANVEPGRRVRTLEQMREACSRPCLRLRDA